MADLTKEEDMKHAVAEAIEKLGGLDILVNRYECNSSAIFLQSLGNDYISPFPGVHIESCATNVLDRWQILAKKMKMY